MNNRVKCSDGDSGDYGGRYWYRAAGLPDRARTGWAYAILENSPGEQYRKKELASLKQQAQYHQTMLENINRRIDMLANNKNN